MPVPVTSSLWWKRVAISGFILLHLYIMVSWGMPGWRLRDVMIAPVQRYVIYSGIWHSWDMFSPEPLAINFNVYAEVARQDGTTNIWEFPRMEKLGLNERFQKERYRKWRERVRQDSYNMIWRDTARFIARQERNPTNPPVRVALVRQWEPIPAPTQTAGTPPAIADFQPIPETYLLSKTFRFYTYYVTPEDLK
jgi:hypothetical protein